MGDFERQPAHDLDAERRVLACMLAGRLGVELAAETLVAEDFYRPGHQSVFMAVISLYAAGEHVDAVTAWDWLRRYSAGELGGVNPPYLAELQGMPVVPMQAPAFARIVWDCAVRRKIEEVGTRLAQMAVSYAESAGDLIGDAHAQLTALAQGARRNDGGSVSAAAFTADKSVRTTPCIPGLLDHQDRVVVVAEEGVGKSMLAMQAGFALACGVHPFTFTGIQPGRVLIIDLENPIGLLQRRVDRFRQIAERHDGWDEENLSIWSRPGGVNFAHADDAFRVAELVRRCEPDLVVAGPVYKMIPQGVERSEHLHGLVTEFFDGVRERYGSAIWLETHAPIVRDKENRRDLRPRGSGIWSQWPEFGIALARRGRGRKDLDVGRFRGDREEGRLWPEKLERSPTPSPPGWPWIAVYEPGTFLEPLPGGA